MSKPSRQGKREAIRGTVRSLLQFMRDVPENDPIEEDVDWLLKCLDSQDVVIKVDSELPPVFDGKEDELTAMEYKKKLKGYSLFEPLIEEEK